MVNKSNYIVFIALLLAMTVWQCTSSDERKTMLFWSSNNAQEIIFTKRLVEQWNAEHPEQPIRHQPIPEGQSSEEIILAAVVGKTTPDIYANMMQGTVEMYANAGVLVPLDTLDGFIEFIRERCSPEVIEEITSQDGHIYQVPWKVNPIITLYNVKKIESLSIDGLPDTYAKYFAAAREIQKDTDGDGYIDQWIGNTSVRAIWYQRLFNFYPLYLAASDGGNLIKDGKAAFNNEHAIGVFRFLQELYRQQFFIRQRMSGVQDPFLMKMIYTQFTGPWQIQYLEKFKPDDIVYGFFPIPVPDDHEGPVYTYGDPKNIVLFNTCKDPELAWDFIRTMISREGDLELLKVTGQFPRRIGLAEDEYFQKTLNMNPHYQVFARQVNHIRGLDSHELIVEVLDIISQEYEACVIYNRKTPEEAIADAEKAVNVLLRD